MSERDDSVDKPPQDDTDLTVMRTDPSVSLSGSLENASGEADAPRVLKQRFVLEEKLGSGGMGTVFRAKDLRKVEARDRQPFLAIKVLNNDFREHPEAFVALQREAVKSQALSHPNIVSIYDFDKDGDVPFMTMELLEGQELTDLIRAYPNGLPEEMAWRIIEDMCAGLKHAHDAGIVHADFKPGNVYVSPSNSAKILDFGIARAVQMTESAGEETLFDPTRLAALTPAYASREMLNGDNPEPRDDLYSLGVVIYLVLTGHHPYGRLSADDAAKEGLVPEKPRRLSYRQWRAVRGCLKFNRQERPDTLSELQDHLFKPSPWASRTAMAAAAAFLLALGLNLLVEDVELQEVKQEVRQITLIDAEVARITALLENASFDEAWTAQLDQEFTTLDGLEGSAPVKVALLERLRETYLAGMKHSADLEQALSRRAWAERYLELGEAADAIVLELAATHLNEVLDAAAPTAEWIAALEAELEFLSTALPPAALAALDLETADVVAATHAEAVANDALDEAAELLALLERLEFDRDTVESSRQLLANAERDANREARAEAAALRRADAEAELAAALAAPCLRVDVPALEAATAAFVEVSDRQQALTRIDARARQCLDQLKRVDVDRALALRRALKETFGSRLVAASERIVDPCAPGYLVGNGTQSRGYCADELDDGLEGPRLVVVPTQEGGRYAITKHEISWSDFGAFCAETGRCAVEEENTRLPVTDVSIAVVSAFAGWLSERSGYIYRLPTATEWRLAARGQPDPNRNCRVQLDGVARGLGPVAANSGRSNEFGLLNMLGNVQELVRDDKGLAVLGGAFDDPIGDCVVETARAHGGEPQANTGFRLVREIT